jgi:hypothetical protein
MFKYLENMKKINSQIIVKIVSSGKMEFFINNDYFNEGKK